MDDGAPDSRITVDPDAVRPAPRILLLNGALPGDEALAPIEEALVALLRDAGTRIRDFQLRDVRLAYCQGCFECWLKSPGLCKTEGDAGREIAAAMIGSDLTVLLTPITFGGYSSEIKKALDRSICLASPFFRRVRGEVRHRPRYREYPALAAVGVLREPDEEEARIFRALVERNARNSFSPVHAACVVPSGAPRSTLRDRLGADLEPVIDHLRRLGRPARAARIASARPRAAVSERRRHERAESGVSVPGAVLLVGSARPSGKSSSEALGRYLLGRLADGGMEAEAFHVSHCQRPDKERLLLGAVDGAGLFVLSTPLYVDALPYLVTRCFERIAAHRAAQPERPAVRFVALVNCGYPEWQHTRIALAMCRVFARQAGFTWGGALGLGGGEAIGGRPLEELGGMTRHVRRGLDLTAAALLAGRTVPREARALFARPMMPSRMYTVLGTLGWLCAARRHGTLGRLRERPLE